MGAVSIEIVWFRRDLRVRDHPALHAAAAAADQLLPVFVVDPEIVEGPAASGPRAHFLAGCLHELDAGLREHGGRLVVRHGDPAAVLVALAQEVGASRVRWTSDASPHARRRDRRVTAALVAAGVDAAPAPGQYVADPAQARTQQGGRYTVFGPFRNAWERLDRRTVLDAPAKISVPQVAGEGLPTAAQLGGEGRPDVPEPFAEPGEAAGLRAARAWLDGPINDYADRHDRLAGGTSGLSRTSAGARSRAAGWRHEPAASRERGRRPSSGSWPGATSTRTSTSTAPRTATASTRSASGTSSGRTIRRGWTRGRRGRRATRWSTRGCVSWPGPAGCTTARGWSSARS